MKWSPREVAILYLHYSTKSWSQILSMLPGRNQKDVSCKAVRMGLKRSEYNTSQGMYFLFAFCSRHGRIPREEIVWRGKKNQIPYCPRPYCTTRLRLKPRSSRLRRRYRNMDKVKGF